MSGERKAVPGPSFFIACRVTSVDTFDTDGEYDSNYVDGWIARQHLDATSAVLQEPSISIQAKVVLLWMWSHARPWRGAWVLLPTSVAVVAKSTSLATASVRSSMTELMDLGWLSRGKDRWFLADPVDGGPLACEGGYVYVTEFSDGTVKVGKTMAPPRRLAEHTSAAARFGISVTRTWTSFQHRDYDQTETLLLIGLSRSHDRRGATEYFCSSGAFESGVRAAEDILFLERVESIGGAA